MASLSDFAQYPSFPNNVPVADVSRLSLSRLMAQDQAESELLYQSCRSSGFFLLDLQGNDSGQHLLEDVRELRKISAELFDLKSEEKIKYSYKVGGPINGYKGEGVGRVDSKGTPDRYELYNISEDDILEHSPSIDAPLPISNNRSAIKSYINSVRSIVDLILTHLNSQLHLPLNTLSSLHNPQTPTGSQVRLLRFSPQPFNDRRTSLLHHTDIGSITILFNVIGGLQILPPGSEADAADERAWRYVKPEPGCAIVNLGDSMVQLTNGLLRSNVHRVTYAPGDQAKEVRFSLGFFAKPKLKALMNPLEGSDVIPALREGQKMLNLSAEQWAKQKTIALRSGEDNARSRGGSVVVK